MDRVVVVVVAAAAAAVVVQSAVCLRVDEAAAAPFLATTKEPNCKDRTLCVRRARACVRTGGGGYRIGVKIGGRLRRLRSDTAESKMLQLAIIVMFSLRRPCFAGAGTQHTGMLNYGNCVCATHEECGSKHT